MVACPRKEDRGIQEVGDDGAVGDNEMATFLHSVADGVGTCDTVQLLVLQTLKERKHNGFNNK